MINYQIIMVSTAIEKSQSMEENQIKSTKLTYIRSLIKFVIIGGWIFLAGLTCYIIIYDYGYNKLLEPQIEHQIIKIHWHLAITIFIIVLACSFFLQTLLIEIENKNDLRNKIVHALNHQQRNHFIKERNFYKKEEDETDFPTLLNVNKDEQVNVYDKKQIKDYEKRISQIIQHLGEQKDLFLYQLYRQVFNMIITFNQTKETPHFYEYHNSLACKQLDSELNDDKKFLNVLRELSEFHIPDNILDCFIDKKIERDGLALDSYILPVSFFLFIYFIGIVATLPLVNSIFEENDNSKIIPFPNNIIPKNVNNATITATEKTSNVINGIPLIVIQWGFLGGLVYTSISLLRRFLRKDLPPRVYYNAAFRLLLSGVASVIIYFLFLTFGNNFPYTEQQANSFLLLLCFSIGIAPIQFLIRSADMVLSKFLTSWRHRNTAGKRSLINIEGIDSVNAERLSEEGLDYIQQLALCDPIDVSFKTKFSIQTVRDWKDQAILYLLTADIIVKCKTKDQDKQFLFFILNDVYGIRRFTQFDLIISNLLKKDTVQDQNEQKSVSNNKIIEFAKGLGYTDLDLFKFKYILESILKTGISMNIFFSIPGKEKNFHC